MVIFPNIAPYDSLGAVATFGSRHYIPMTDFQPEHIASAFGFALDFFRRIEATGHPESVYHLINWNYMPPAGSSLIHPHLQVFSTSSSSQPDAAGTGSLQELSGPNTDPASGRIWSLPRQQSNERYLGQIGRFTLDDVLCPHGRGRGCAGGRG